MAPFSLFTICFPLLLLLLPTGALPVAKDQAASAAASGNTYKLSRSSTADEPQGPSSAPGANTSPLPLSADPPKLLPFRNSTLPLPFGLRGHALSTTTRAEEERRSAWSTKPVPCIPPGLCTLGPYGTSGLSICGSLISSQCSAHRNTVSDCSAYCSSSVTKALGATLFQFNPSTFTCKCFRSCGSLSFSAHTPYVIGYTDGLCSACKASQVYVGGACKDCGNCFARPTIGDVCYSDASGQVGGLKFIGTTATVYQDANCNGLYVTVALPANTNAFACTSVQFSPSPYSFDIKFDSNCNNLLLYPYQSSCSGSNPNVIPRGSSTYTLPTLATC